MTDQRGQVRIENIYKRFGETVALNGCNLTINSGEVHAIVGENGSGKSTLAKIVSGVVRPDFGFVSVFGEEPRNPIQARALGVAMIFQEILVAENLSVMDNVFVGMDSLWKHSYRRADARAQSRELLRRFSGLDIDPDTPVQDVSLSIKQWIVIARALVSNPRVLILDESSAALDLDASARLYAEIGKLRESGCCVIVVTHRIAEIVRIADRATVLRDGAVVGVLVGTDVTEVNLLRMMSAKDVILETKTEATIPAKSGDPGAIVISVNGLKLDHDAPPCAVNLHAGEIIGITGLEGQGHSDFVRVIAGLQPFSSGRISLNTPAEGLAPADAEERGRKVAYISGDRAHDGIFPNLSIFENFALPLYRQKYGDCGWIKRPPLQEAFDEEVRRLSIKTGPTSNLITSLSGGNQQKILIGRVLATNPEIIVLDDPARGVDAATKRELYVQLKKYAQRGGAVIYLSSEIEEFFDFADRVLVFRNKTLFRTVPAEAFSEDEFLAAMFGKPAAAGSAPHGGVGVA